MSMTQRILASWRRPRMVMRGILAEGPREDRALVYLMGACFITFVSQWPVLSRAAYLDPSVPLEARLGASLLVLLFIAPLIAYAVAALSHVVMRLFGGQGSFFTARMAMFWAMLATAPLMLLYGLLVGFVGPTPAVTVVGTMIFIGFLYQWGAALREAEAAPSERGEV